MGEEGKEGTLEQEEGNDNDNSQVGNEPFSLLPVVHDDFALLHLHLRPPRRTLPRLKCSSASCRRWPKSGGG